jgi:hypothetical protein
MISDFEVMIISMYDAKSFQTKKNNRRNAMNQTNLKHWEKKERNGETKKKEYY